MVRCRWRKIHALEGDQDSQAAHRWQATDRGDLGDDRDNAAQIAALKSAGCELIFQEKATGGRWERPEFHRLLGQLRKSDVLVVWSWIAFHAL
ncbi:recombinase family protein [Nitrosovibrio sp. Nv4]|uniref:recombinase family protein n=1 Tax=Nitrosovibrio sp. Nv4 TaxID=1945880 RepID=UPI000D4C1B74